MELGFSAEAPRPLFVNSFVLDAAAGGGGNPNYDMSPAGERFVFVENLAADSNATPELYFVLSWFEELQRLVPTN